MPRLIDADALLKNAIKDEYSVEHVLVSAIRDAPTIDAEPLVRCKDCQHWGTGHGGETDKIKVCEFANYMVGKNGYCVYGERKDGSGGAG